MSNPCPCPQIIDIPNSMTVLPELLPYSLEMARRGLTGVMNYTNPGAISHNEILELYKQYIDPDFTWSNFTVEEQAKVIVAPRSNNLLDTARIESEFPEILPIKESLIKCVLGGAETTALDSLLVQLFGRKKESLCRAIVCMTKEYPTLFVIRLKLTCPFIHPPGLQVCV